MAKKDAQPQYLVSRINNQVRNYNVYIMEPSEKLMYTLLVALCGGAVGLIFYGGLFKRDGVATMATTISNAVVFVGMALIALKLFMPIITESLRQKQISKLRTQFCDFAPALANALGSGMNVQEAMEATYRDLVTQYSEDELIVQEVREILDGVRNNISVEDMILDFGQRSGVPDIVNFGIVFATCFRTGGNIKSIVRRTSEVISEKLIIASEIETTITSNKMQMSIMNVLPIVIVLMMRLLSAEFAASFASALGVLALTISAGLFIGAYKWGQKIMDIKG